MSIDQGQEGSIDATPSAWSPRPLAVSVEQQLAQRVEHRLAQRVELRAEQLPDLPVEQRADQRSEQRSAAVEHVVAVAEYDGTGRLLSANARFVERTGRTLEELVGCTHRTVVDRLEIGTVFDDWAAVARGEARSGRYRWVLPDREMWVDAHYLPTVVEGVPVVIEVSHDVSALVQLEQRVRRMAATDALTGLANRSGGVTALAAAMERAALRGDRDTAVIVIGLDGFKRINDELGHRNGDEVLQGAAERLDMARPRSSTIARLGGDEFLVVLDRDTDDPGALEVASTLLDQLRGPLIVNRHVVHLDASAGITVARPFTWTVGDVLREAECALREAKSTGRGRVAMFDQSLRRRQREEQQLASLLERAVTDATLAVHYQPIVELGTGRVVGVEALARLRDDAGAPVPPARFVEVAERSDLVVRLDVAVLDRALGDMACLLELDPHLRLAVNFSRRHLRDPGFADLVLARLDRHRVPAANLTVEITETLALVESEVAYRVLTALRDAGVSVAIDDFGTGYASIGTLRNLPIDMVKIDRSFVQHLDRASDRQLMELMIGAARHLGLRIVVEGIESPAQIAAVRAAGGELGQGFALGRPVAIEHLRLHVDEVGS